MGGHTGQSEETVVHLVRNLITRVDTVLSWFRLLMSYTRRDRKLSWPRTRLLS